MALASVRVRNLGQGSAKSADIIDNGTAWAARAALANLDAAHLHVVEGGVINDWLQSTAVATVSANLATMLTAVQTKGGDVLLLREYLNGAVVKAAAEHGLLAPVNSALVTLVHEVEHTHTFLETAEVVRRIPV